MILTQKKWLVIIITSWGMLSGFNVFAKEPFSNNTKKNEMNAHETIQSINIAKVAKIKVPDEVHAVGHIYAIQQVDLSFNSGGHLHDKFFKNGDRVLKGEVIAKLDDSQDLADLKALKANLFFLSQNYKRLSVLKKSGAISLETLEQKKAELVSAQSDVEKQIIIVQQDKLIAPFTGVLSSYKFDIGSYISSGSGVVQLTQEAPLKVVFSIPAQYRPKIAKGNEVQIKSSIYNDKLFKGLVNYISPTVNQNSGTINIEANIPNAEYLLTPGMFVTTTLIINTNRNILVVPDTSVQVDINGQYIYKLLPNKTVKRVKVKVGIVRNGWSQIITGVSAGEEIVSIGGYFLVNGQKISISDIPPPQTKQKTKTNMTISDREIKQGKTSKSTGNKK